MNKLIIIDDTTCKDELNEFVSSHADHIKLLLTEEDYNIDLDGMVDKIKGDFADQKIVFIATKDDILKLSAKDILFIQSKNDSTYITLSSGISHQLNKSLNHYKINLKFNDILQINRNCLINMKSVKKYSFQDYTVFLNNDFKFN